MTPPHAPVSLVRCASYDQEVVAEAFTRLLAPLGGMAAFVKPGRTALIKPNLLLGAAPGKCVCTHPEALRAAIRLAASAGVSRVLVGDSPAVQGTRAAMKKAGLLAVVEEERAEVASFEESVEVAAKIGTFRRFEIARPVLDADVVINFAKAKTHSQMVLTLAVKNTFGCLVGTRKQGWHLKAGSDYPVFARMLLDLHRLCRVNLNLIDGVVGMQGDGPANGSPIDLGFIGASTDAVSLDVATAWLLRVDADRVPVLVEAARDGYSLRMEDIPLRGDDAGALRVSKPVILPESVDLRWHAPRFLTRYLMPLLTARPIIDPESCRACGLCRDVCPPAAIATQDDGRMLIDHAACIRCFCCQEVCPYDAVRVRRGLRSLG